MSMYINIATGEYPVSFARVKKAHPTTSFSTAPAAIGDFKWVADSPMPVFNADTQYVTEGAPTLANGDYFRSWIVNNYSQDEIERKAAKHTAVAAAAVRENRNALLAETDWWAVQDRTMTQDEKDYRQALRDITAHANFPHLEEADWPVKP